MQDRARREALYGEFIWEASKLFADAFEHELDDPAKLVQLYAIVGSVLQVMLCLQSNLKSTNLIRLFPSSAEILALHLQHYPVENNTNSDNFTTGLKR
jgi:hypothetical protein